MNSNTPPEINELYTTIFNQLDKMLKQKGCPPDRVKEIYHEALLIYTKRLGEGIVIKNLKGYILEVAYNQFLKDQSRRKKLRSIEDLPGVSEMAEPEESGDEEELERKKWLEEAIPRLSPPCIELLNYIMDELRYKEIAQRMNLQSERNVKDRKAFCIKKLRDLKNKNS